MSNYANLSKARKGGAMNTDVSRNTVTPKMKPLAIVILSLTVIICAAYLGSGFSNLLGIAVLAVSLLTMLSFARSLFSLIVTALSMFLIWSYTGNFYFAVMFCAAVTAIGAGAFLLKLTKWQFLIFLAPLSYLTAWLLGGSLFSSALSLAVFPAIAVMAFATDGKLARINVICRVSVTLVLTSGIALLIYVALSAKTFDLGVIKSAADKLFDAILGHYTEEYAKLADRFAEYAGAGATLPTAADARIYAAEIFGIIPAIAIITVNVLSFLAYHLEISLLDVSGQKKYLTPRTLSFSMSFVSALTFIVAYFASLLASYARDDTIALIAENIYLILLPGFVFTGILVLLGKRVGGRRHIFWLAAIIVLFFVSTGIALGIAAFIGCSVIIFSTIFGIIQKHNDT